MHFRSTASTALRNSMLTRRSRQPLERVFFFLVERDHRLSVCSDLTDCKNDADLSLYAFLSSSSLAPCSRFARRAPTWRRPMSRLYTTTPDIWSNTIKSPFRYKSLQTSSLWTISFFFSIDPSIDRSIHRSIDRTLRAKFQRINVAPHKMSVSSVDLF
jgi:hypothetical protein